MNITIEPLQVYELKDFLHIQASDAFPDLKDEYRLNMLAEKWYKYAEFCTSRDDHNKLVGMIAFYANRPDERIVFIPHVYVASQSRRNGLFSGMLELVEHECRVRKYSKIRLEVAMNNQIAIECYSNLGFRISEKINGGVYMEKQI